MDAHNSDRTLIGLAPAALTEAGIGLTMLSGIDLASLLAPLFVLCGVHVAPDVTPTFSYFLIMAAKIWAGFFFSSLFDEKISFSLKCLFFIIAVTLTRLVFAVVWFTTEIGSARIKSVAPSLMLFGLWCLLVGEALLMSALSAMCCVHKDGCGSCEVKKASGVCCCNKASSCGCNKVDCAICTSKKNAAACKPRTNVVVVSADPDVGFSRSYAAHPVTH